LQFTDIDIENTSNILVGKDKLFIETGVQINIEEEQEKIKKDIAYYQGFIVSIEKKLSNGKFVQNAKPEVIENERKKLADGKSKLQSLEESLAKL